METKNKEITPCMAIHPGDILADELEARGITQKEFASKMGMFPANLNKIIKGKAKVTKRIAEKLEELLGITKEFWLDIQKDYEINLRTQAKREFDSENKMATIPLAQLLDMQEEIERLSSRLNFIIASQKKKRTIIRKQIKQ
ncbi:MAG: HigA family addiction module antitoxin [Bacteroidota bacterium]|nr:HigA family addiction module antitoxin [Bacteroidota bacterium]